MVLHSFAPDWPYEETKERLLKIPEKHFRAFAVFLYVLGARINEGRKLRFSDVSIVQTGRGERVVVSLYTEKNPRVERRNVPINPLTEKDFFKIIDEELDHAMNINRNSLFPYSERYYRKKIRTYLDVHPHALRHLRVHHIDDKSVPGLDSLTPRQYQDYFGWETIATSSKYQSRTRSRDLAERF